MYNKEQLMAMKVDELRKVASSVGIKNAKRYKKADLVENILHNSANDEKTVEVAEPAVEAETKEESVAIDSNKLRYISEAPIGTLVAFRLPNGKTKSAKIINRSTKNKLLKLETVYGKQFIVPFCDVVWVKSTSKWPRGVYNQLKGIAEGTNGTETA